MLKYKSPADEKLEKILSTLDGLKNLPNSKNGSQKAVIWFQYATGLTEMNKAGEMI
jgi:hypothetical protein